MNERAAPFRRLLVVSFALALLVQAGCLGPPGSSDDEERSNAMKMRDETLAELYVREPGTKPEVEKAAGYICMKGGSLHLGLISLATAYMVIVDNETGKPIYDNMFRFGLGPGLAVKSYHAVSIIHSKEAMQKMCDKPWLLGILLEASFKFGDFGGSVAGIHYGKDAKSYYWTGNGFALEAAVGIAKTWHDSINE